MKNIRYNIKYTTLLLLMLTLHILMHNLVVSKIELTGAQEGSSCEAASINQDDDNQEREGDCKPPKSSFIDYSTFFSPKSFLPAYTPIVSVFMPHEPFRVPPLVYLEIIVPPDNLA